MTKWSVNYFCSIFKYFYQNSKVFGNFSIGSPLQTSLAIFFFWNLIQARKNIKVADEKRISIPADKTEESYEEAEKIFEKYDRLRNRRNQAAKVLSGGERRLLEISRALVMKPSVLLVDEPSIGLEPRYIEMVFEILNDLQKSEKKQ